MEHEEIEKYIGYPEMTIVDSMRKIDITSSGILFIVDPQRRLIGALTDGDIRRWLIKTGDLNINVSEIMQKNPYFLIGIDREQALKIMIEKRMRALPIIDEEHQVIDIVFNTYNSDHNVYSISQRLKDIPVVIMAGGKGTRLLPYTHVLPKPLIPIGDKPILERIIDQFCRYGCRNFYLILNYKKNMIKAYFNELNYKYHLEYIDEEKPLGTGGGLALLKNKINGPFILSNCDILVKENFSDIFEHHIKSGNRITMICSLKNFKIPYGIVHTGSNGTVTLMEEKPTISFFANTGCYIIDSEILNMVPDNNKIEFPEVIDNYRKKGNSVGVYPISEASWLDMGQIDELEKMRKSFEGM